MPSKTNATRQVTAKQQGCLAQILTAQRARDVIPCSSCNKPRMIYADMKLNDRQQRYFLSLKQNYNKEFVCGYILVPENDVLDKVVYTYVGLSCESPVQFSYYGCTITPYKTWDQSCGKFSNKSVRKDICCYCLK